MEDFFFFEELGLAAHPMSTTSEDSTIETRFGSNECFLSSFSITLDFQPKLLDTFLFFFKKFSAAGTVTDKHYPSHTIDRNSEHENELRFSFVFFFFNFYI